MTESETKDMMARAEMIQPLVEQIKPILAGKPPDVQSAVIADLLAMWVCGMVVRGDRAATEELRDMVLARHIQLVIDLVKSGAMEPTLNRGPWNPGEAS